MSPCTDIVAGNLRALVDSEGTGSAVNHRGHRGHRGKALTSRANDARETGYPSISVRRRWRGEHGPSTSSGPPRLEIGSLRRPALRQRPGFDCRRLRELGWRLRDRLRWLAPGYG